MRYLPAICIGIMLVFTYHLYGYAYFDYLAFVTELRSLPAPQPNEIVYFDSHPIYFTAELFRNATAVALRRSDIEVQLVSTFPPEARYKLHYEKQRLTQVP